MKELFGGRYSSGIFPATNQNQRSKSASTQKKQKTPTTMPQRNN
jgi:hypothetical protein